MGALLCLAFSGLCDAFDGMRGRLMKKDDLQTRIVRALYGRNPGRLVLRAITKPWFSRLAGGLLETRISKAAIKGFVNRYGIDINRYENEKYKSFNDFFIRRKKICFNEFSTRRNELAAPCDGWLTAYRISEKGRVTVKGISYTMEELVRNRELAKAFEGGTMLLFRLTVSDYHRYHYPDSGVKSDNTRIDGSLHTVNPIAAASRGIYRENAREYFTVDTDNFGKVLMMQVGALLVGRIHNRHSAAVVRRGNEAGWFDYGGSTVILCFREGTVKLKEEHSVREEENGEIHVETGQVIGKAVYGDEMQ